MADAETPAPPRKRGFFRKLLRTAVVLLVLLAVLAWFAPALIAKTGLLNTVLAKIGADLNGKVTADGATLGWFSPVNLRGVKVTGPDRHTMLTAETVTSSRTLYQLVADRGDLGTFTIANPNVEVVVVDGMTNVERFVAKYLYDSTPAKPDRTPVTVELTGGTVVLREPAAKLATTLDAVNVSLTMPKSRAEAITLAVAAETRAPTAPGKLHAEAAFLAGGKVKLTATDFAVGHLAPLLHRFERSTTAAGRLTADLTATWKTEANKPFALSVDGTASAAAVRLAGTWLGPDTLVLESVSAPCKFSYANGVLAVQKSNITCDVGSVEFAGTLDPQADPETLANQAGLQLKARLDVAKLAVLLPKTLHIKAGTEVRSGVVTLDVHSIAGKDGPTWTGSVTTTKFEATRDGTPIVWESPLSVAFAGRLRADKTPHFDTLEIRSDFLNVNARGELEAFEIGARANLGALADKLGQFADLGKLKLNGAATVQLVATRQPAGGFTLKGSTTCDDLLVSDGAALNLNEKKVFITYDAAAAREPDRRIRIDTGTVGATIGTDKLAVSLRKPIPDARALATGEAHVTLVGDLQRWQGRLGGMIGFPAHWTLGGTGTVTSTVRFDRDSYAAAPLNLNLTDAVFRMPGTLDLNERQLIGQTDLRYHRATKAVTLSETTLTSNTLGGTAARLDVKPASDGEYGLTGTAKVQTDLDRLQKMLLLRAADGSDALGGLAVGTVAFDMGTVGRYGFNANLDVTNFRVGPPAKPSWTEPKVKVKADGAYDTVADALTFKSAHVARDGLTLDAAGRVGKLSTVAALDVGGTITYDLDKVEPVLKEYLGKSAQVKGKGTKPFNVTGDLAGGKPGTLLERLGGQVTVAWQDVKAYGFDVGPSQLGATLKDGIVYMTPVEAAFGGGKVKLTPGVSLRGTPKDRFLNFAKGKIIDTAKLTPAACADAIGYALPAIANAAQADGTFSFDLEDSRIPFADPTAGTVRGKLTVHQANVSPGPVITRVLEAVGVPNAKVNLSKDNVVPIEFKDGRVYHRDFTMTVDGVVIKTAGSVGVDGTVKMDVELPLSGKLAGLILPNNPRLREALGKQSIHIPVGGTLTRPALDPNAFRGQLANLIRGATKDAASGAVEDFLKKGLGGLLPPKK